MALTSPFDCITDKHALCAQPTLMPTTSGVSAGAATGGAAVLEKVQRPDADIPHMLSLGEEFNRAVRAFHHPTASPLHKSTLKPDCIVQTARYDYHGGCTFDKS